MEKTTFEIENWRRISSSLSNSFLRSPLFRHLLFSFEYLSFIKMMIMHDRNVRCYCGCVFSFLFLFFVMTTLDFNVWICQIFLIGQFTCMHIRRWPSPDALSREWVSIKKETNIVVGQFYSADETQQGHRQPVATVVHQMSLKTRASIDLNWLGSRNMFISLTINSIHQIGKKLKKEGMRMTSSYFGGCSFRKLRQPSITISSTLWHCYSQRWPALDH